MTFVLINKMFISLDKQYQIKKTQFRQGCIVKYGF